MQRSVPSATCVRTCAEYFWQCSARGRMEIAEGHLVFLRVEIPTSDGAAGAEDLSERGRGERDDDARSVMIATSTASADPMRTHEDMQELVSELD